MAENISANAPISDSEGQPDTTAEFISMINRAAKMYDCDPEPGSTAEAQLASYAKLISVINRVAKMYDCDARPGSTSEAQPGPTSEAQPGPSYEPQPGPSYEEDFGIFKKPPPGYYHDKLHNSEEIFKEYRYHRSLSDSILLENSVNRLCDEYARLIQTPLKRIRAPKGKKKPKEDRNNFFQEFLSEDHAAFIKDPLHYIDPRYRAAATVDKNRIVTFDLIKLSLLQLRLNDPPEPDKAEKERDMELELTKKMEEEELAKRSAKEKERKRKGNRDEELEKEKLTEFKYEKKNKLWNRKAPLRQMYKKIFLPESRKIKFTEGGQESFCKDLTDYIELDLHYAVNILRLIAYPKLCKKHFSPEFPSGAFAKDDENISISVEHFEFMHEKLSVDFLKLVQSENFNTVVWDLENDPQINSKIPSLLEFLKNDSGYQFLDKCFTIISAVLKNPYRNCDFFLDMNLPVVKEQIAIVEYLMNCLQISNIFDKNVLDKCAEVVIRYVNIHSSFLALIAAGFDEILNAQKGKQDFDIYCRIINVISYGSLEATIIDLCLPKHFEKLCKVAVNDTTRVLYFHLLKACEMSITYKIEGPSLGKTESSKKPNLDLFHTTCHQYFGSALTVYFRPLFRKYEEQYLVKKRIAFPITGRVVERRRNFFVFGNKRVEKNSNLPQVFESISNSVDKILSNSSTTQLGYRIQEDTSGISFEDAEYLMSVEQLPLPYMKTIEEYLVI